MKEKSEIDPYLEKIKSIFENLSEEKESTLKHFFAYLIKKEYKEPTNLTLFELMGEVLSADSIGMARGLERGLARGREEGINQSHKDTVLRNINKGTSHEDVANFLGITVKQVQAIVDEAKSNSLEKKN